MTSLSMAEKSLEAEGNLHSAKDPTPTETKLYAGVAANEVEPETSMQMGMAGSGTDVRLPSDGRNGTDGAINNEASLLASPVWPAYGLNCR